LDYFKKLGTKLNKIFRLGY